MANPLGLRQSVSSSSILRKERKFIECFRSNRSGSCNHCRTRSWLNGYKIYAMKKPDGGWIACTDRKCYLEQGGRLTLFEGGSRNIAAKEFKVTSRCHLCNSGTDDNRIDGLWICLKCFPRFKDLFNVYINYIGMDRLIDLIVRKRKQDLKEHEEDSND